VLAAILEKAVDSQGLWHYQTARRLGVGPSTLSRYLTGKAIIPDEVLAMAIRELDCPELGRARCQECHIARAMAEVERKEAA